MALPEEISSVLGQQNLAELEETEVIALIDAIVEADLTDEQADAIAEALSAAPNEVKAKFEAAVNVYGGQFDTYVPKDSVITVAERRAVVAASAVTAVAAAAPTPTRKRR